MASIIELKKVYRKIAEHEEEIRYLEALLSKKSKFFVQHSLGHGTKYIKKTEIIDQVSDVIQDYASSRILHLSRVIEDQLWRVSIVPERKSDGC